MAATGWKLDKELCRCCHGEEESPTVFLSLTEPVYNLGVTEVYLDMLKSCLDIELAPVVGTTMSMKICGVCVHRLIQASSFKRQVLRCEERFKQMYNQLVQVKKSPVKQEDSQVDVDVKTEIEEDPGDGFEMKFDDSDDDQPIITIKVEDSRKPKRKAKATVVKGKRGRPAGGRSKAQAVEGQGERDVGDVDVSNDIGEDSIGDAAEKKKGKREKYALNETDYRREGEEFVCTHCELKFYKFNILRAHVRRKHHKVPRYICSYCKKGFMTPAPWTVHKLEEHNVDERFKCKACNSAFNTKVQLRKHTNNYHMLGEKYKCPLCEYESFSFEGVYKHKVKHKTVKDHHCRFCKKSFLRKTTLDLHERIHTGDRRKVCNVCGQAFVQKASLNYHMAKYHPEVNF